MREKIRNFMIGRYGFDQMSQAIIVAIIVLMVFGSVTGRTIFSLLSFALLIYMYFRVFSKNIYKRQIENQKYLEVFSKAKSKFQSRKKQFEQRKEYKFFRCPACKQQVRVPRGHGRIRITCPKCRAEFEENS